MVGFLKTDIRVMSTGRKGIQAQTISGVTGKLTE